MNKKSQKKVSSPKIPLLLLIFLKIIQFISESWVTIIASKIFCTPFKFKTPKREFEMVEKSEKSMLYIPSIQKNIMIYEYGKGDKTALLVHGWSGRGTQLVKIADELIKNGFKVISFDAPAHGKSEGKRALMPDLINSILEIDQKFGHFDVIIGHSLGAMSTLNAIKEGLKVEKAVIIGSGDIVQDILDFFIKQIQLKPSIAIKLKDYFEKKSGKNMNELSAYFAARSVKIPVLIFHDKNDNDVPVKCSIHIHDNLEKSKLYITEGLGHRKILGDSKVIKEIIKYVKMPINEVYIDFSNRSTNEL